MLSGFCHKEMLNVENICEADLKHFVLFTDITEEVVEKVGFMTDRKIVLFG